MSGGSVGVLPLGVRRSVFGALLAALIGATIGVLNAEVSPEAPMLAAVAVATVVVVGWRPEIGALAVVYVALVVPRDVLATRAVPLAGGSLKVTDLLIALSVGAWLAHRALDPTARRMPSPAAALIVIGAVAWGGLSLLASGDHAGGLQAGLTDYRPFLSLLLVFPLVAFVRDGPSLRRSLEGLLVAGAVGSLWITYLFLTGEGTEASFAAGALRVTEVSFVASLIVAVWSLVLIPHCRTLGQRLGVTVLAVGAFSALFFTLQRGAWLALLAACVVAAFLMTPRRRARLLLGVVVLLAGASLAIVALNSASSASVANPLASGLDRLQSVGSYSTDVSALHREAENRAALREVRTHPLVGVGLGGTITFFSPLFNPATEASGIQYTTGYLHNSYTWMAVKTGLPGLAILVCLVGLILFRGARLAIRGPSELIRVGASGIVAPLAALIIVSFTGPHLTSELGMPYLAAILAGVEALRRLAGQGEQ